MSYNTDADEVVIATTAAVTLNIVPGKPVRVLRAPPSAPTHAPTAPEAPTDVLERASDAPSTSDEPSANNTTPPAPDPAHARVPRILVQGNHPVTINIGSSHHQGASATRRWNHLNHAYLFDLAPRTPQAPAAGSRTGAFAPSPAPANPTTHQPAPQQGNTQVAREKVLEAKTAAVASAVAAGLAAHPNIRVTNFRKVPLVTPRCCTSQNPVPGSHTGDPSPTAVNPGADQPAAQQGNHQHPTEATLTAAVSAMSSAITDMLNSGQPLSATAFRNVPLVASHLRAYQNPVPEAHTGVPSLTTVNPGVGQPVAQEGNDPVACETASASVVATATASTDVDLLSAELAHRATVSLPQHDSDPHESSRAEDTQTVDESA